MKDIKILFDALCILISNRSVRCYSGSSFSVVPFLFLTNLRGRRNSPEKLEPLADK